MYCERCNKYFSEDKSFCNVCGGPLTEGNEELSKSRIHIQKDGITASYAVMLIVSAIAVVLTIVLTYGDKWFKMELFSSFFTANRISFTPCELWDEVKEYSTLLGKVNVEEWKITALNVTTGAISVLNIVAIVFSGFFVLTALFRRRKLMIFNAVVSFLSYTIAVVLACILVKYGNVYISDKTLGKISLVMTIEKGVLYSTILYACQLVCAILCTVICKAQRISPVRLFRK